MGLAGPGGAGGADREILSCGELGGAGGTERPFRLIEGDGALIFKFGHRWNAKNFSPAEELEHHFWCD